jgi:hypothetical protein
MPTDPQEHCPKSLMLLRADMVSAKVRIAGPGGSGVIIHMSRLSERLESPVPESCYRRQQQLQVLLNSPPGRSLCVDLGQSTAVYVDLVVASYTGLYLIEIRRGPLSCENVNNEMRECRYVPRCEHQYAFP